MVADRLFDPADYGVTATPRPGGPKRQPGPTAVTLGGRWELIRCTNGSPVAHLRKTAFGPRELRPASGAIAGECGVYGGSISDLDGVKAPACPRCVALAQQRGERL